MWQAEADKELTLSASPATAVGEQTLTLANRRYSTVFKYFKNKNMRLRFMHFTENELSPTKYESNHASKLAIKLRASNKSADTEKIAIYTRSH